MHGAQKRRTVCQTVWLEATSITGVVDAHWDVESVHEGDVVPVQITSVDSELGQSGGRNAWVEALEATVAATCTALQRRRTDREIAFGSCPDSVKEKR